MGGSTITRVGKDKQKLVEEIKTELQKAVDTYGLFADSALILLNPSTEEVSMYHIKYDNETSKVTLEETTQPGNGAGIALAVAGRYEKKPTGDEWVATVHTHT